MLADIQAETHDALEDLRDLARGSIRRCSPTRASRSVEARLATR